MKNLKFKRGINITVLLIIFGILGITTAITVPKIISNNQKSQLTKQLFKSYDYINNGFKQMLENDNVKYLSETKTFQSIGGENHIVKAGIIRRCTYDNSQNSDNCKNFYNNLRKYFKITNIKEFNTSDNYTYTNLNDEEPILYKRTAIIFDNNIM